MTNDELFEVLVNGFVGSWSAGINAYVDEKKPISYGVQCIVKSLINDDIFQVNVYKSKKAVRIVLQGKDSDLLKLAKQAFPVGEVTEEVLTNWRCIYV